jgi:hypothetical protein
MKMPGFTAETSLYKTRGRYSVTARPLNALAGGRGVLPQLPRDLITCLSSCQFDPDFGLCRDLCYWNEFTSGGGGGSGGDGGSQLCTRACTACLGDPHSASGFSKTCRFPNCESYKIECLHPLGLAQSI